MDPKIRNSWAARLAAIGFIVLILAGNAWLCLAMLGIPVPEAASLGFVVGIVLSLLGGVGMVALTLKARLQGQSHGLLDKEDDE